MYLDNIGGTIDQQRNSKHFYRFIKERLEQYFLNCDEMFSDSDVPDDFKEDVDALVNYFNQELSSDINIYTYDEISNAINKYISDQILESVRIEYGRERNKINRNSAASSSAELSDAINNMPLEKYYNRDWVSETIDENGDNILQSKEADILYEIDCLVDKMNQNTPWGLEYKGDKAEDIERLVRNFIVNRDLIIKKLNRIGYNLLDYILSKVKSDHVTLKKIKDFAINEFKADVQSIHELYSPEPEVKLTKKERKALKKASYESGKAAVRELVKVEHIDQPKEVQVTVYEENEEDDESDESGIEAKYIELGQVEIPLPWMEDQEKLDVRMLKGSTYDVFLTYALSPDIKKISNLVRGGEGKDKLVTQINEVVKRISDGIMPYQNTRGVLPLKDKNKLKEPYRGLKIWYTKVVGNNAIRIYFILKETPESLSVYSNKKTKTVIVIAETDKQHQSEVYNYFTKFKKNNLRENSVEI